MARLSGAGRAPVRTLLARETQRIASARMRGILAIPRASTLRGWRALLAVLLCAATAGGCAMVADIAGLTSRIQDAGYENVQVNHKVTNGVDVLTVEAVTPNEPATDEDALRIAEIVWTTYPRQVDRLDLVLNGRQVVSASRQDLTEEFGQRNPDLDKGTGIGRILLVGLAIVGVMLVLLVLLIVLLIRRGRRRARQMPN